MMTQGALDTLAGAILAHLAACPDLVDALIAETGLAPADLRAMAADPTPAFAAAMVDFICTTDDRLLAFSAQSDWPAATVAQIREALAAGMTG